jgi:hypothetical protein
MPYDILQIYFAIKDAIAFEDNTAHLIEKIVDLNANNKVTMFFFAIVTDELLTRISLSRTTSTESTRAMKSGIVKVVLSGTIRN